MKMKKVMALVVAVVMMFVCTGCPGGNSSSEPDGDYKGKFNSNTVQVFLLQQDLKLKNVSFYNFGEDSDHPQRLYTLSGTYKIMSNSATSKECFFQDKYGYYVVASDKALASKPDEVRIYTNVGKTGYNTYVRVTK